MMHYVYIIYSLVFDKYYKGYTTQPLIRLEQHNSGESRYTRSFIPWELVYLQSFSTKREALKREKSLKKYGKSQLLALLASPLNELDSFKS